MVCVLFTETVTRLVVGGGGGLWVVISLSLSPGMRMLILVIPRLEDNNRILS